MILLHLKYIFNCLLFILPLHLKGHSTRKLPTSPTTSPTNSSNLCDAAADFIVNDMVCESNEQVCEALANLGTGSEVESCDTWCSRFGTTCVDSWNDDNKNCEKKNSISCDKAYRHKSICRCSTTSPTASPTKPGTEGDPHFITWSGQRFDFHGVCDLVLLSIRNFHNDVGMDVHIRSERTKSWSFISSLAIRIGKNILEVIGKGGGHYILNGNVQEGNNNSKLMLSGYPLFVTKKSKKQQKLVLDLGKTEKIEIKTWNSFVSIHFVNPTVEHFANSVGLMGSFPGGKLLSRDKITTFDDFNKLGQEWQVLSSEENFFHNNTVSEKTFKKCIIPSNLEMRRRLKENKITQTKAERACGGVEENTIELCVFDVMAMDDVSVAGAY